MGTGSAHLDNSANDITTLAASFNGPISYTDATGLTVGTVTDGFSGMSTSGITSSNHDEIGRASCRVGINQSVTLGTGNLTLVDTGNITQSASGSITAAGLQEMGTGSAHLDNSANDITTLAASFSGPISYTDATGLSVGTVTDGFSGMSTSGITSSNHDVKLTAGGNLAISQAVTRWDEHLTELDSHSNSVSRTGLN